MSKPKQCTANTKKSRQCLLSAKRGSDFCGTHKHMDDLWAVREQFEEWFRNLEKICKVRAPWIFLCLSAVIDYLSRLEKNAVTSGWEHIAFIKKYFPNRYKTFKYKKSNETDLPTQMLFVLRNGIVHSFSLIPTPPPRTWQTQEGKPRAIVLDHAETAKKAGYSHLDNYPGKYNNLDAAYFVAEDFLKDVEWVAYDMLQKAKTNNKLKIRILTWFENYPPITWGF